MGVDWAQLPPEHERGPPGKIRPFWRGFFLSALTLSLYHLWWHHRVHKELMRFTGRDDRIVPLWVVYAIAFVVFIVFLFVFVLPELIAYAETHGESVLAQDASQHPSPPPLPLEPVDPVSEPVPPHHHHFPFLSFLSQQGLLVPYLFLYLLMTGTFAAYVIAQHRTLYRFTDRFTGWGAAAFFFLSMYFGAVLLSRLEPPGPLFALLLSAILLGMLMLAYYTLQTTYNNLWREIQTPSPRAPGGPPPRDHAPPVIH